MSASWCAPCFSSIDIIDDLEEYWSDENSNVRFVTALSDIGQPYSCEQWGIEGVIGSPLIVEDDGTFFSWFQDSNGQYPSYVLIDHTMTVRAKPSNMFSNSNDNSCDGSEYMDSLDSDCLNSMITDLLDECGDGCSSGEGCSDESACNSGDSADCIYPEENYNCCGECAVETDCLGECGGDATDEECASNTGECNLPTCHLVFLDSEIYSTIQSGIDAAVDGDTVLVEQGTYYENLLLDKEITLTSRAIFDDLNGWIGYEDSYVILNDNITGTIIDGSEDTNGDDRQSTILINSPDECIEPTIFGFTITGGNGTNVLIEDVEKRQGGGILSNNALPKINYNFITNNSGDDLESGGAVQQTTDVDFPALMHLESGNFRCEGDVDLSFNFYRDNDADYGNTLGTEGFEGSLDMSNSIFDIYNCPEEEVSPVWVDVDEEVDVDFNNGVGDLCSITEDVYVSPDGDDNNIGTSISEAFLTIQRALEMIAPQDDDPVTIFLTEGTFSPSTTGETFPITMISNVNLIGQGEEVTIIDAQQTGRVITMENCDNNIISDLTLTGGLAEGSSPDNRGGGMYLVYSNPNLTHVTISNNTADYGGGMRLNSSNPNLTHVTIANNMADYGGGMYLNSSNPNLTHVTISNNTADLGGGGMYLYNSNPILTHVTISNNTADLGGGMYLPSSNPILTHVTISNNTAEYNGGGMNLYESDPMLTNVTISNNMANYGGGIYLGASNPTLTNVTIANNTAGSNGGGMRLSNSDPILTNSIIWTNSPESIYGLGTPVVTYSDIEGGWEGEGNIDNNPFFTDPENEDYTLQLGSPCIDTGDPFIWYNDIDMTRADMGITGGLFLLPNFTNHDFGEVGDIGSSKQFSLYNFRETPITISSVNFETVSFTTGTSFPITIEPLETGIINIDLNNSIAGTVNDNMEIISVELPQGLSVGLSGTGVEGNVLTGNLSGTYPVATYRISGDLTIADGDTAYLNAGTEFLFDGGVNFNIYGTLKAIGTESDSIIFDNFGVERWRGFTLDNASDETTFEYVRISGAEKSNGGGMYLLSSNPTLTHVTISNNTAYGGGGMFLSSSNPTLTHVTISNNTAAEWDGGGMYLYNSDPTLTHVTISNNTAGYDGGGMSLSSSNPILTHVTISNNTADLGGGMSLSSSNPTLTHVTITDNTANYGGGMFLSSSNPTLTHVTISNNTAAEWDGGGMYLYNSDPTLTHVTISNNTADHGGGMSLSNSDPILTNSIIWINSPEAIHLYTETEQPIITYSDIEDGWEGEGNINTDPLFNDDYTLQEGSPCIDAGTIIEDMEYCDDAPDMGAFEYITEDCTEEECGAELADVNGDSQINILDLVQIANLVLEVSTPLYECAADYNQDGQVNILDLVQIANYILDN